jgi:hypothetical protein
LLTGQNNLMMLSPQILIYLNCSQAIPQTLALRRRAVPLQAVPLQAVPQMTILPLPVGYLAIKLN